MKKSFTLLSVLFTVLFAGSSLIAQDWVSKMQDPSVNFFEVQKTFNEYVAIKLEEQAQLRASKPPGTELTKEELRIPGYKIFKRWEWFMEPRVSETGERFNPMAKWEATHKYAEQYKNTNAGNWSLIGPSTVNGSMSGAGRLNFVRIHPGNANTIFVGSPSGGLWKSTNGGGTWTTNTDWLDQVIGCTDIAIDPADHNIMYLATGDGDAGDNYTVGLLKSTDGGNSWNKTGLTFYTANFRQMSKVLVHPVNTNIIIVITSGGIYRSTDAAVTFTQVQTGSFKDMEFKVGNPDVLFACGSSFFRSTNAGATWTQVTSGLPASSNVSRMAIATSDADSNYIYLIAGLPGPAYGTEGFYRSTNGGTSFTKMSTPNIGTQQWYDLCVASSPGNKDEILLGGQTQFLKSTNGGTSFSNSGSGTHVDYHDVLYTSATTCYMANDGGVYRSTNAGSSWSNLSNGLAISQMYGFGQSATNANLFLQGWQDNGTNRYNGTSWATVLGGDGMLCFIDYNNDLNMWAESQNGGITRSTNGGSSFSSVKGSITETGAWVTPWLQDPVVPTTIYAGFINVWKSTVGGGSWTKISAFTGTNTLNRLAVSPANNQVIWASNNAALYKTSNGGATWTTITSVPSGRITYIACSNTDPNKAWVTFSGFNNKNKVFQTNDQGATWINISASLPNVPVNCIVYAKNSADALYIGTDLGIFFKDSTLTSWQPFFTGLPNVEVTQLEIFYPTGKIRASTYGRGLWESDLYVPGNYPPSAYFISSQNISCPGAAVQFTDFSAGQPTAWQWSFPGAMPFMSAAQHPVVYYNSPGNYDVTLIVTNANGTDTINYTNYISISNSPHPAPTTVGDVRCNPGVVNLSASSTAPGTIRWWDSIGGGNVVATGQTYSPTINGTTTYYVDVDISGGNLDVVGELNKGATGAYFVANDIRGLYFDVLDPIILNTMEVYSNSAGNRTIEVIDGKGNTVVDTTIFIPASPTVPHKVTVNFKLYPGNNYFIKCRGNVDLWRESQGANYPYNSSSVNITESNASIPGYYYFFYNWEYTTFICNTERTPCVALDSCQVVGVPELFAGGALDIFPNPNSGAFTVAFEASQKDQYFIEILNPLGQIIYRETLDSFSGKFRKDIDLGKKAKGIHIIRIGNSKQSMHKKLTVN